MNSLQGSYNMFRLNVALKRCKRYGMSVSSHCLKTMLQIASGPGALYGLSLAITFDRVSLVMMGGEWTGSGYKK